MAQTSTRKQVREAAMHDLGLFIPVVADSVDTSAKTVTISKLADASPNPEWLRDSFLHEAEDAYRRIVRYDGTKVFLTDNLAGLTNGEPCGIYFLASPEDCNKVFSRTLTSELHSEERTEIPLVAGSNEYALPAGVETKADILGLTFRDTNAGTNIWESEVGGVRWIEDSNGLTAHLPNLPMTVSNVSLVVHHKEHYPDVVSDAGTTTCPFALAWTTLEVNILNFLVAKYGKGMKEKFSTTWSIAERRMAKLKAKHMPPITSREFTWDQTADFVDIPTEILEGSW